MEWPIAVRIDAVAMPSKDAVFVRTRACLSPETITRARIPKGIVFGAFAPRLFSLVTVGIEDGQYVQVDAVEKFRYFSIVTVTGCYLKRLLLWH